MFQNKCGWLAAHESIVTFANHHEPSVIIFLMYYQIFTKAIFMAVGLWQLSWLMHVAYRYDSTADSYTCTYFNYNMKTIHPAMNAMKF